MNRPLWMMVLERGVVVGLVAFSGGLECLFRLLPGLWRSAIFVQPEVFYPAVAGNHRQ
jgi:hypothetical protein